MPWSWKTTIWKPLAKKLDMKFLDFDENSYDYKFSFSGLWQKQETFKEFMEFFEDLNLK